MTDNFTPISGPPPDPRTYNMGHNIQSEDGDEIVALLFKLPQPFRITSTFSEYRHLNRGGSIRVTLADGTRRYFSHAHERVHGNGYWTLYAFDDAGNVGVRVRAVSGHTGFGSPPGDGQPLHPGERYTDCQADFGDGRGYKPVNIASGFEK